MPTRCLYEVLGVERSADDDTIKKAYRKQALLWHPDKNQHRIDEAHEVFQEIQNAYEVLSDKHERAWYDSHRDQILRSGERHQAGGGGDFTPGQRPDDEPDLYQYFTASCFRGFGDGPKGFYGVYSNIFDLLAEQERAAWQQSDAAGAANATPPAFATFGQSDSPAADVFAFYNSWSSFVTCKEFAWADLYNPAAAPNRQVRRKMEDENRKARRNARREYNDNVRELVAFVKKRDKRVAKAQAEEAVRRAEQQAAEAAKRAAERQERLRRAAQYQEPDWVRASEAAQQDDEETEGSEEEVEEHYCVVCEKRFRSAGQLANHERSKKHQEALAELRELLQEEEGADADWLLGGGTQPADSTGGQPEQDDEQQEQQQQQRASKGRRKKGKRSQQQQQRLQQLHQQQQDHHSSEHESEAGSDMQGAAAAAAARDGVAAVTSDVSDAASQQDSQSGSEAELDEEELLACMVSHSRASSSKAKQKQKQQPQQRKQHLSESSSSDADVEAAAASGPQQAEGSGDSGESDDEDAFLARLASRHAASSSKARNSSSSRAGGSARGKQQQEQQPQAAAADEESAPGLDEFDSLTLNGRGSKGRRKGRSTLGPTAVPGSSRGGAAAAVAAASAPPAAAAACSDSSDEEQPLRGRGSKAAAKADKRKQKATKKAQAAAAASGLLCMVCSEVFDSRSQLFKHIAATGHAAPKQ